MVSPMSSVPENVLVRTSLDPRHEGYDLADAEMFQAISEAETRHFWQLSRNRLIADELARLSVSPGARILELGCGGGCVSAHLARLGYAVTGVDGHLSRVLEAAKRAPSARFIVEDLARDGALHEEADFDAVGLFDVIEHLADARAALELAVLHARPGGWVVGTVPALMALWSDADRRAGHVRRYEESSLGALLRSVRGAADIEVLPFNRALVPLLWLQRRLSPGAEAASGQHYYRVPWAPMNRALYALLRFEHRSVGHAGWLKKVPGASLWFSFRKGA
jgi:SAM-dependent methyltransferase